MAHGTTNAAMVTIGLDLGDRQTAGYVVDAGGQILERFQARTTPTRLLAAVTRWPGARVVLEVGGQSPWVSRRLQAAGYGVVVANARRVRLIAEGDAKSDRLDAELLARLGRVDPALLAPIQHRSERTQRDLGVVKTRAALVRMRTLGINHGRGVAKALGHRLPACAAEAFPARVRAQAVGATLPGITELLAVLEQLTASIRALDRQLATLATTRYPVTELLRQVPGVGPLTALTYVLTLEDPTRFPRSRTVGAYLGLRPKRRDSGAQQPELSITKAGDVLLRRHLVTAAQYILGPFGPDTDLRRWGLALAGRGGKAAKKRAVVAVARKLAVLLHRLWLTGEVYEPVGYPARAA